MSAYDTKMNTPSNSQNDDDVDDKVETTKVELNAAAEDHIHKAMLAHRHNIAEAAYNKGADDGIKAGILMGLVAGGALLFVGWLAWSALGSPEPTDASKRSNE